MSFSKNIYKNERGEEEKKGHKLFDFSLFLFFSRPSSSFLSTRKEGDVLSS
jgi:hypothetical protein